MNAAQLESMAFDVKDRMAHFVSPFVTPISQSDSPDYGWACGTGSYVCIEPGGGAHLLTNEHVAVKANHEILAHLPRPGAEYERIISAFRSWQEPIDVACAPIDWRRLSAERDCLAMDQFDASYRPVADELLFWIGYPGTTLRRHDPVTANSVRYSWGGELSIPGVPMVSQALRGTPEPPPDRFDPCFHQLIHYPNTAKQVVGGPDVESHNPEGISGSLIWDTKRVACHWMGKVWKPEYARVCAILWAASEASQFVVATRVEHVRACLIHDAAESESP